MQSCGNREPRVRRTSSFLLPELQPRVPMPRRPPKAEPCCITLISTGMVAIAQCLHERLPGIASTSWQAMAQALTKFLESHAEVFCSHIVPHLDLLSLRSAACCCSHLHRLIVQAQAATLGQVRHNTWLLAHQNLGQLLPTQVSVTHDTSYPCAASMDNQLAAFLSGNNLLTIVRWQEPGHIVAQVHLPHFHKVSGLNST